MKNDLVFLIIIGFMVIKNISNKNSEYMSGTVYLNKYNIRNYIKTLYKVDTTILTTFTTLIKGILEGGYSFY